MVLIQTPMAEEKQTIYVPLVIPSMISMLRPERDSHKNPKITVTALELL
jgi:hypothetical protein